MNSSIIADFRSVLLRLLSGEESVVEFQTFKIEKCSEDHPLKNFDKSLCTLPILLAYKDTEHDGAIFEANECGENTTRHSSQGSYNDTSLGGSPLKLEEFHVPKTHMVSTSDSKHIMCPIDVQDARYLLSLYCLCTSTYSPDPIDVDIWPLWVLCNGSGPENITLLSSHFIQDTKSDESKFKSYSVVSRGPFIGKADIPKLTLHGQQISLSQAKQQLQVQCSARYEVFSAARQLSDVTQDFHQSTLTLHLQWHKLSHPLQTPPLDSDLKTVVEAYIVDGDMRSAAFGMYADLCVLKNFVEGLNEDGVTKWEKPEEEMSVLDNTKRLVDEWKADDIRKRLASGQEEKDIDSLKNVIVVERKDLDFTEQLWMILKECGSYSELVDCLQYVFSSLMSGIIQPNVHKNNKSMLAQLVRDSYNRQMAAPLLKGFLPLQILTEIGIEKIKRDYIEILVGKELVTFDHLSYFLRLSDLSFAEQMTRLEKLHHVVELVVILQQFLSLQQMALSNAARSALKQLENNDLSPDQVFVVPIQRSMISSYLDRFNPYWWKVKIKSHSFGNPVHTIAVLSTSPSIKHVSHDLPHNSSKDSKNLNVSDTEEVGEVQTPPYYYTLLTEIITEF